MNTQIEYTYTDRNNFSTAATAIIGGELTQEEERVIFSALEEGLYFIPSHVGLPEPRSHGWNFDDDHSWFKLEENAFSKTDEAPTVPISSAELAQDFSAVRCWETDMPRRKLVSLRITGEQPILQQFIVPISWGDEELLQAVERAHHMELEKGNYVGSEEIQMSTYVSLGMIPCLLPTMTILRRNLRQEAMEADGIENACCNTCNYAEGPVCLAADKPINDFDSQRLCCRCVQLYDVAYMPGEKQAWKSKRYIITNEELLQDPFRLYTVLAKYDAEIAAAMEAGFVPAAEDISPIED